MSFKKVKTKTILICEDCKIYSILAGSQCTEAKPGLLWSLFLVRVST